MASRFCQSFIFGVLVVALVLTSGKWKKQLLLHEKKDYVYLFLLFLKTRTNHNCYVKLIWWNYDVNAVPEAVTGFTDPGLNCHGPCTPHCNTDCTNQGSKKGFCLQQGSLNLCCCSWFTYIVFFFNKILVLT